MIFKESDVDRIHQMLRHRSARQGGPTTLREAIRFTLENARPMAVVGVPLRDPEPGRAA